MQLNTGCRLVNEETTTATINRGVSGGKRQKVFSDSYAAASPKLVAVLLPLHAANAYGKVGYE